MFNAVQFLTDYRIPHKIRNDNWVTVFCPLCHSVSGKSKNVMTGAFSISDKTAYTCFRCGTHPLRSVITALIPLGKSDYYEVLSKYDSTFVSYKERKVYKNESIEFSNLKHIDDVYIQYLEGRGFNALSITKEYDLKFANHYGNLADRVIIPIYYKGKIVSYTARTILKDTDPRYISCSEEKEVIKHKTILFGLDNCIKDKIIVLEAPINVMKAGYGFSATFGTSWTLAQLHILKEYSEVFIIFDSGEHDAQKSAYNLSKSLNLFTKAYVLDTETPGMDIGDFSKDELKELCKYLNINNDEYYDRNLYA